MRYALKQIFDEPPTEASIQTELDLAARAFDAGARTPRSHPDRDGHYLVTVPDGTWLRCYDWVDLQPVPSTVPDTPRRLGALLARLHQRAPSVTEEPNGGGPADPWYHRVPEPSDWAPIAAADASWAACLTDRLTMLPQLCAAVAPVDPARLLLCHRDLHPENVFVGPDDVLVVVDWDDLGPADPGRELARALFDWWCDEATTDIEAVYVMTESYLREGGPGRITGPADFSMLLAARLNFLLSQAHLALDPETERAQQDWAQREIDAMLHLMPTPHQLAEVLAVTRECAAAAG
jgi:Ser/Thr protein kinase RdoA (MazF antagonist)